MRAFLRIIVFAGLLLVLLLATWSAGRAGISSLLTVYGARANQISAVDATLRLSPEDPEAHYVRGAILESSDLPGAIEDHTKAVQARPDDYVLWLHLAHARELNGQIADAIAAARQAVSLAPFYAQPHWRLGNILVRAGAYDEGFTELRQAGQSDPTLLPAIIDLGWNLSSGDAGFVNRALQPSSPESYKALANHFKKHGAVNEAIEMFRAAGASAHAERRQYLQELISAKSFPEAWVLWLVDYSQSPLPTAGQLINPSFELESNLDDPGFGWRRENKAESLSLSLDPNDPREGRSSLRIDFKGESAAATPVISQFILVEPDTRYQIHFASRSEDIVSGGLPFLAVIDAADNTAFGQLNVEAGARTGWQDQVMDFRSGRRTNAIQLVLRRQLCNQSPCPIFGRLWLDDFSLRRL